jgi:hypothetical protein
MSPASVICETTWVHARTLPVPIRQWNLSSRSAHRHLCVTEGRQNDNRRGNASQPPSRSEYCGHVKWIRDSCSSLTLPNFEGLPNQNPQEHFNSLIVFFEIKNVSPYLQSATAVLSLKVLNFSHYHVISIHRQFMDTFVDLNILKQIMTLFIVMRGPK